MVMFENHSGTASSAATGDGLLVATPERDCHEVLGVPRDADAARIRAAFRDLASKYHPDRNPDPGAEGQFTKITEAYAALSGPDGPSGGEVRRTGGSPGVTWLSPEDLWAGIDTSRVFRDRGSVLFHRNTPHAKDPRDC